MAKTKLTDQLIDELCTYIENGMSNKDAADLCQISDVTLYRWLREADTLDDKGKEPKEYKQQRKLKQSIQKAKAAFKAYHVQSIIRASKKQWTASAWLLERKFPEEFGAADRGSVLAAQRAANSAQEDDGLIEAITASADGIVETGDEPEDV